LDSAALHFGKGDVLNRYLIGAGLAALFAWALVKSLPNDQKAIQSLLTGLVQAASIKPNESGFARLAYADRLAGYFTTNVTIQVEGFGTDFAAINGRTELVQAAMAARSQLPQAQFELADLNIKVHPDKHSAGVYAVVRGQINYETNRFGHALKMVASKSAGRWLISQVQTVPDQ
jgi:hypothetical protein